MLVGCTTACDCRALAPCPSKFCRHRAWLPTTRLATCWCSGDSSSTTTSTSSRRRSHTPASVTAGTVMKRARRAGRVFRYQSPPTTRACVVDAASDSFVPAPCVAGTGNHRVADVWSDARLVSFRHVSSYCPRRRQSRGYGFPRRLFVCLLCGGQNALFPLLHT